MDFVCYSHLRWNFVYQRPQHLLTRFAKKYRVFYIEEPLSADHNHLIKTQIFDNLFVIVPHLQGWLSEDEKIMAQQHLLDQLFNDYNIGSALFWYYTPMALPFSRHLKPNFIAYDCMDELSAFKFAPPALKHLENELLEKADIVFTGGVSLYNAKKNSHHNIYPVPSSIDKEHFGKAQHDLETPADQRFIPQPRIGFYGVIDERFNLGLLGNVAERRPEWRFVIIGPVVKIDEGLLPRRENIYYLGGKSYDELPAYLSGWDIAIIPFLLNESTRYISPTKTPEYLAAGKPVISTSIADVVDPYGLENLVHIADNENDFIAAAEKELSSADKQEWLTHVDQFLSDISWDKTWMKMEELINKTMKMKGNNNLITKLNEEAYV